MDPTADVQFENLVPIVHPPTSGYLLVGETVAGSRPNKTFVTLVDDDGHAEWGIDFSPEFDFSFDGSSPILHRFVESEGVRRIARFYLGTLEAHGATRMFELEFPAFAQGTLTHLADPGLTVVAEPTPGGAIRVVQIGPGSEPGDAVIRWVKEYSTGSPASAPAVLPLQDGSMLLTWIVSMSQFGFELPIESVTLKIDPEGNVQWSRRLAVETEGSVPTGLAPFPRHFQELPDGSLMGTGTSQDFSGALFKLQPGGQVAWAKQYQDVSAILAPATALARNHLFGHLHQFDQGTLELIAVEFNPATGEIVRQQALQAGEGAVLRGIGERENHVFLAASQKEEETEDVETFIARLSLDFNQVDFFSAPYTPAPHMGNLDQPMPFSKQEPDDAAYLFTTTDDLVIPACGSFAPFAGQTSSSTTSAEDLMDDLDSSSPEISVTDIPTENFATETTLVDLRVFLLLTEAACPDGSKPAGREPSLEFQLTDDGELAVSWEAESGTTYHIESTSDIGGVWGVVESITPEQDQTVSRTFTPDATTGFYRVRVEA